MAAKTLTRTEGDRLLETRQAARLSDTTLVTHTAVYIWSTGQACWLRVRTDSLVSRCQDADGRMYRWDRGSHTFVRETAEHDDRGGRALPSPRGERLG